MAYIATKATYIGEEEVKDDDSNVLQRRIITDVDDVVFNTGEVIVLLEEESKDKHFDLTIEDKGSKYFKPTQIKIGDGFHSFKELNWIQTFDPSRMESVVSNGVTAAASTIMGKFTDLENTVNNFIHVEAGKILQELVKGRYFTLSDDVVLSCFNTEGVSDNELKSFSIGYNNKFNYNGIKGKRSIIFGIDNNLSGFYNYINGASNKIEKGNYGFINGAGNTIQNKYDNNKIFNVCFGLQNTISDGDHNFVYGVSNYIHQTDSDNIFNTCFGKNNRISGQDNFIYGHENAIQGDFNTVVGENNYLVTIGGISKHYYCFVNGRNNSATEDYSYVGGYLNYAGGYSLVHGESCNRSGTRGKYTACFGKECNTKKDYTFSCGYMCSSNASKSFTCGSGNVTDGEGSFSCGRANRSNGRYSFTCGLSNSTDSIDGAFACGKYNIKDGKLFSVGKGSDANHLANIFDIDTSGKATFYGDLEVKGQIVDNMQFINKTDFNKLKEQVNNIVITSTGDGNAALEVASARVGLNNINYSSLSDRLDADFEKCIDKSQLDSAIQQALIIDDLEISGGIINSNRGNSIYDDNGNKQGRLAMGSNNAASGTYSVAIGFQNTASGKYSTAIGDHNTSSDYYSIAMGYYNTASNHCSIAMGQSNTSSGAISVAMGDNNTASNHCSVAIGHYNTASGEYSASIGTGLIAIGDYQTALGKFNIDETEFDMRNLFVLGNGTSLSNRSNAMEVDTAGNLSMNRDVVANAFGDSPISLVELSNRIGLVEEKLAKLVTPERSV